MARGKSINEAASSAISAGAGKPFSLDNFKKAKFLTTAVKFKAQQWIPLSKSFQDVTSVPGIPMGHISLLRGHSDTGKTTAMLEAAVSAQKMGVLPVFLITEMKWNCEHAKEMGLEVEEVVEVDEVIEGAEDVVETEEAPAIEEAVAEEAPVEESVEKSDEVASDASTENNGEVVDLVKALDEIKDFISATVSEGTAKSAESVNAVAKSVADVTSSFATKQEELSKTLAEVQETISQIINRVDAVESDTAVKKSGELENAPENNSTLKKSMWGGRFLGSAEYIN